MLNTNIYFLELTGFVFLQPEWTKVLFFVLNR